jgi:hypothetical protein
MTRARDVADTQDNLGGAVAPFVGGKNFQINGGFDIWQRGTTLNNVSHNTYTADQWVVVTDSIGTVNLTQQNISAQGLNSTYCMRVEKSAGASNRVVMVSVPEGALSCVGKTVTLSGYFRKGSGLTSNVNIAFGTRANRFGTVYDYANDITVTNASLNTSTFTKFTMSFNVTTATSTNNANIFEVEINYNQTGGANVYLDIAAIQIEVGSVATPFSRAGGTIQGELAACQRYYYRAVVNNFNNAFCMGQCYSTTQAYGVVPFPVTMRTSPTALEQTGTVGDYKITTSTFGGSTCTSVPTLNVANTNQGTVVFTASAVFTAGHATSLQSGSASAYLGWSAEL